VLPSKSNQKTTKNPTQKKKRRKKEKGEKNTPNTPPPTPTISDRETQKGGYSGSKKRAKVGLKKLKNSALERKAKTRSRTEGPIKTVTKNGVKGWNSVERGLMNHARNPGRPKKQKKLG